MCFRSPSPSPLLFFYFLFRNAALKVHLYYFSAIPLVKYMYLSLSLKMRRKDSDWASLSSLLTEAQVQKEKGKGKKTERTKRRCYEKRKERWKKLSNERLIIQVEWLCFYRLGEHGMNMLKAYTRQKVLSWGLSVFPFTEKGSPQTEVHHICFAAQLPRDPDTWARDERARDHQFWSLPKGR